MLKPRRAQEEARRQAASEMARHRAGWSFGDLGAQIFDQMRSAAEGRMGMRAASAPPGQRVGQRKRAKRAKRPSGGTGGAMPTERALLPAACVED